MNVGTGKAGYILFRLELMKQVNASKESIENHRKDMEANLREGLYFMYEGFQGYYTEDKNPEPQFICVRHTIGENKYRYYVDYIQDGWARQVKEVTEEEVKESGIEFK